MARFELSSDTRLLTDYLLNKQPGELVSYEELAAVVGRPVNGGDPFLRSAIHRTMDDGLVFENIRGKGYKCLTNSEIVQTSDKGHRKLGRTARQAARRLSSVEFGKLNQEERIDHQTAMTMFAMVNAITRKKSIKKLRTAVTTVGRELPLETTLAVFAQKDAVK